MFPVSAQSQTPQCGNVGVRRGFRPRCSAPTALFECAFPAALVSASPPPPREEPYEKQTNPTPTVTTIRGRSHKAAAGQAQCPSSLSTDNLLRMQVQHPTPILLLLPPLPLPRVLSNHSLVSPCRPLSHPIPGPKPPHKGRPSCIPCAWGFACFIISEI